MGNLVIVAIPDENDRVWKVSSEKVPHLTLLFLGDESQVANEDKILEFVQHAADTTLNRFYMTVDRRGELGPDKADVLFFKKGYDYKAIRDFRSMLLKDNNIKTAYDAAEQFDGPWLPHLTLGYPETPAKDLPDEWGPLYSVDFNKIAVWTGNFEGPDFLLKDYWDDFDLAESVPMDMAMSDLQHYGVKGMHWGVRKFSEAANKQAKNSPRRTAVGVKIGRGSTKIARGGKAVGKGLKQVGSDIFFESATARSAARTQVVNAANLKWGQKDIPRINKKYEGTKGGKLRTRLTNPLDPNVRAYREEARIKYRDRINEAVADLPTNKSGTRRYEIEDGGKTNSQTQWSIKAVDVKKNVRDVKVKHADDTPDSSLNVDSLLDGVTVQPIFDEDGYITGVETVESSMAQTAELGAEFLAHYGVKGMRWGQHKAAPAAVPASAMSHVPQGAKSKTKIKVEGGENHPAHEDAIKVAQARAKLSKSGTSALSNGELREVANRLQLEQQVHQLTRSSGQKFVGNLLKSQGNQAANQALGKGIKKGARKVALGF